MPIDSWLHRRKLETAQKSLSEATNNAKKLQELMDRAREEHKLELSTLRSQHEQLAAALQSEVEDIVS